VFVHQQKKKIPSNLYIYIHKKNKYIREFVEHYKNYGVDKIFLYDNNELNGERFEEVINDYIED
jgi:hypothetical protein